MVWFEDAVSHYGVPTVVFALYILVPDIDIAAQILISNDWKSTSHEHGRIGNHTMDIPQRRLTAPSHSDETKRTDLPDLHFWKHTVLLPATDFKFELEEPQVAKSSPNSVFPQLAGLLDALIESLLDCSSVTGNTAGPLD